MSINKVIAKILFSGVFGGLAGHVINTQLHLIEFIVLLVLFSIALWWE